MSGNIVLIQVLVLFILMAVGFFAGKKGMIGEAASKQMTQVLVNIISPCVIIVSFQQKFTGELVRGLLISAAAAAGVQAVGIFLGRVVFNNRWPQPYRKVLRFAATYCNAGFMGLPLLQSVIGSKGIIYGSVYIAVFNLFCWTHGVVLYQSDSGKKDGVSKARFLLNAVLNPNVFAILIGVFLFALSIRLPSPLYTAMHYINDLNTPLSMLIIGSKMTAVNFRAIPADRFLWPGVLMRNLAVPAVCAVLLHLAGLRGMVLTACLLQASCPVAGNTVIFAELFDSDTVFPSELMTVSTLLSVLTIPLMIALSSALPF